MKVFKPVIGTEVLAYRLFRFRPNPEDVEDGVGTVVARIPIKGRSGVVIGRIVKDGKDMAIGSKFSDQKNKLMMQLEELLNNGKTFTTLLPDEYDEHHCLIFEWSYESA